MSDTGDKARMHMRESLSALMDGEANELEMRRVLNHLADDDDLRATALGYQRIGETIRKESHAFSGIDLSGSIQAAIADEPAPAKETPVQASGQQRRSGWVANIGRFAVAASVAVATVVSVQTWNVAQRSDGTTGGEVAAVIEAPAIPAEQPSGNLPTADMFGARGVLAGIGASQPGLSPEQMNQARGYADQLAQARFRAYMMEHAEHVSGQNGTGVMPFVRAASFEAPLTSE